MRRVVIELSLVEVAEFLHEPLMNELELFEALSILRVTPKDSAIVGRIKFKNPETNIKEYFSNPSDTVQVLEREGEGSYICFFSGKLDRQLSRVMGVIKSGYLTLPYEVKDGHVRVALLGSAKVVKEFLRTVEEAKLHYKVVSLTDAKFSSTSPLGKLTQKQQRVIISAFEMGYYDTPRRVSSEELARSLNIAEPTLVVHRRKAERRLLAEVLQES